MRHGNAFIGIVLLIATALLILFGIAALSPLKPEVTATNDGPTLTALERPTVMFGNPIRGSEAAAVTIVEFGDFQCEPCSQIEVALAQALIEYPGKVRIVWKDLPNAKIHPEAVKAAAAARCAAEQSAFWEYHDVLLANQPSINDSAYLPFAAQIGLDLDLFQSCLSARNVDPIVERDIEEALRLGVDSTPFLFINGRRVSGAIPYEQLKGFIDAALADAAKAPAP